jgi:hypothetical protein
VDDAPRAKKAPVCVDARQGGRCSKLLQSEANLGRLLGVVKRRDAHGSGAPCAPDAGSSALGIVRIRAQIVATLANLNELRKGYFRGEIYPAGVVLQRKLEAETALPEGDFGGISRGTIDGLSNEAARRLRAFFITSEVEGFELWAVTLTTHRVLSPEEWREAMKRERMAVLRAGWAGVWRVELQKRKAPHAHVAMWVPRGTALGRIADMWLDATGEGSDFAAVEHAVHGRRISHDEAGWAVYLALHDGKHKEAQLGWLGKQWGIWNRAKFVSRDPERFELTPREHGQFLRILRHLDRSIREGQQVRKEDAQRYWLEKEKARGALPPSIFLRPCPRPKEKLLHRGNLLRCVRGETVSAIVGALMAGRIYGGTDS